MDTNAKLWKNTRLALGLAMAANHTLPAGESFRNESDVSINDELSPSNFRVSQISDIFLHIPYIPGFTRATNAYLHYLRNIFSYQQQLLNV